MEHEEKQSINITEIFFRKLIISISFELQSDRQVLSIISKAWATVGLSFW